MDEVEIISLHKRCNKTGVKAGAKAVAKAPRSRYHLFLREQLGKMKGEDQKNYRSIVWRRWKEIKEDPARLFAYSKRARQMRDEAEKPTKSRDDPSVGSTHEETVTESSVVKRTQRQPQKAPNSPEFVETESDDSDDDDDDDDEERKPMIKRILTLPRKAPKSPKLVKADPEDSGDSDTEDTLRAMGFPIDKFLEVGKNEEEPVLKKGIYRGKQISYVAKLDTNYLKKC